MQVAEQASTSAGKTAFVRGVRLAIPIILGYLPVGFTFGVLASKAGMSPLEAGITGLIVFAGSGQLIAVNLMLASISPFSIIMTTFVVNARHMLMSAAMTPYLGRWSKLRQALYAAQMTDETFALNMGRFAEKGVEAAEVFAINITSHCAWILGGVLGAMFGGVITDLKPYGLDYALAGMFVALLVPHFKIPRNLATAIASAVLSVILYLGGVEQWNVIIATVTAATVGMFLPLSDTEKTNKKSGN